MLGKIKEIIGSTYSIKYQVNCMENIVQWLVRKYSSCFNLSATDAVNNPLNNFCSPTVCGFLTLLKWIHKDHSKEVCPGCVTKDSIWNHCFS